MSDFLLVFLIVYGGVVFVITMYSIATLVTSYWSFMDTPKEIYDKTPFNWVACIFLWVLQFLINPVVWIGVLVARLLYWLFTIGRK